MKSVKTDIEGLLLLEPKVFEDQRGFFLETFHNNRYKDLLGSQVIFVQDNHSQSNKNVLRGLHFQRTKPQGKLVRVVYGSVLDVAVDIRKNSASYGKWYSTELSSANKRQFWIPPGFAHGFLTLSDKADLEYKCTDYYDPDDEGCIIWNDEDLKITWTISDPIISEKDSKGENFRDI